MAPGQASAYWPLLSQKLSGALLTLMIWAEHRQKFTNVPILTRNDLESMVGTDRAVVLLTPYLITREWSLYSGMKD